MNAKCEKCQWHVAYTGSQDAHVTAVCKATDSKPNEESCKEFTYRKYHIGDVIQFKKGSNILQGTVFDIWRVPSGTIGLCVYVASANKYFETTSRCVVKERPKK